MKRGAAPAGATPLYDARSVRGLFDYDASCGVAGAEDVYAWRGGYVRRMVYVL